MDKKVDGVLDKLWYAEQLVDEGRMDEAGPIVESLENEKKLTPDDQLTFKLIKSQLLITIGDRKTSYELADQVIIGGKEKNDPILTLKASLIKADTLVYLSRFDEAGDVIEKAKDLLSKLTDGSFPNISKFEAYLFRIQARRLVMKGEHAHALGLFQKSLDLYESLNDKYGIGRARRGMGVAITDSQEKAHECNRIALKIFQELGNKFDLAWTYANIGLSLIDTGDTNKALENLDQALSLSRELGNKMLISYVLGMMGSIYISRGELNRAYEHLQKKLLIDKEQGFTWGLAIALSLISFIHLQKGELKQSLEYQEQYYSLAQEMDNKLQIAQSLGNKGFIYWYQGDEQKALSFMERSQAYFQDHGLERSSFWNLFRLISFCLDTNLYEKAKMYLENMKLIKNEMEFESVNHIYRIAEALVQKSSPEIKDRKTAKLNFQQLAKEKSFALHFTEIIMINLSELLLEELKAYGKLMALKEAQILSENLKISAEDLLGEVKTLVTKLYKSAQDQNSFTSAINALILQAKLSMIEGDLSVAEHFLNQALLSAEEKHFELLAEKVTKEINLLENQKDTWEELIETNAPYQKRLEQARVSEYLENAKKIVIMHEVKPA